MAETDTDFRRLAPEPRDVIRAAQLLTRVPISGGDGTRGAEAAWAWPVVGLSVGLVQAFAGVIALSIGLPASVAAGLAIAVGLLLTGGLHEDGLADCADGFWGGMDRARRLDILKDSRIGAYGVLALIVAMGMRWALMASLLLHAPLALVAGAMLGRSAMAAVMAQLPFARDGGLAAQVGRPPMAAVWLGAICAILGAVIFAGFGAGLIAVVSAICATWGVAAVARAKIGGQTGDVLGATQVMSELAALTACVAVLS
ncbi:adenosylcobinamide-GDP ribazoletransferase [Gymnodinialimonas ceratoperidinii]|uniref:Adenosylcobinamide-GDP ribazoletransferase n=1 Tax=Gymnodinialimonas ceratoperidinii TaxID=2856823 RepID=A0A8F6TZ29_9RHOB|nr:adenosylcobinamide-GDP ribazoletransferase [Gymnodinialimonas ceratoperidinii]QXT40804.1 adenosylcobinamide-GDP ribazoletransferase [Gymnodinialimonas ceratoperidinii]